jgi:hypothetical protein
MIMMVRFFVPLMFALAAPQLASAENLMANARVDVLPYGTLEAEAGDFSAEFDTKVAYAIGGELYYMIAPNVWVGVAPRYILNVDPKPTDGQQDDDVEATQIDLPVRARYAHPVSPQVSMFGVLGLGYSIIQIPDSGDEGEDAPNASGLIAGFGGGATFALGGSLYASAELNYQLGFQSVSEDGLDAKLKSNYLTLGLGVGSYF